MLPGRALSFRRLQWLCAPVAAGGAIMLGPGAAALAADAPVITAGPVIAGLAQEGETLTAHATWTGSPEPVAAWKWARCSGPKRSCSAIKGAKSDTYVPTSADVGSSLRIALTVTNKSGSAEKNSEPTAAVVGAAGPTPSPAPVPLPAPVPVPPVPVAPVPVPPAPRFELTPAPVTAPPVGG